MLGCQDFCGYYDWTFHYIDRTYGRDALHCLWAQAIGGDAQAHYLEAGRREGLAGLLKVWSKTGEDEHCDWTFTLDESRNSLRWDMRRCPSKGFLLINGLGAYEDYCDHCMGWLIPLLGRMGATIAGHQHNHCGQCWGEIRMDGVPHQPADVPCDIRRDPRWQEGPLDTWVDGVKVSPPSPPGG